MKLCIMTFLISGFLFLTYAEEDTSTASEVFNQSVRFYKDGRFDSTIITIKAFLKAHGKDPAAEYLVPLVMEAMIRVGDYGPVGRLYDLFVKRYRSSVFLPRVHYLQGTVYAKDRSYKSAFEAWSLALEANVAGDLDSIIMASVETICNYGLSEDELRNSGSASSIHVRIRESARYYEIAKSAGAGNVGKARSLLTEFKKAFPESRYDIQLGDVLNAAQPKKTIPVGILAPLSGEDAELGIRVVKGVQLAIDAYNSTHAMQLKMIPYDTKGSVLETAQKAKVLLEEDRVSLVIGPVLSLSSTVAAAWIAGKDAVMLSPTATDDGIADLGHNIFQMNSTLGVLARKLARYAVNNLNIKEFAVIAPATSYGATMSAAFRDEVLKNKGTIFDEQSFEEGANDFSRQFIDLRRKLLLRKIGIQNKSVKPLSVLSRKDSIAWADSIMTIGGIFIPAETDDIVLLAPHAAFHRIKAQLLGSNGWHSPKVIYEGKQYVQNAIFSATFEPDTLWKPWAAFKKEYTARFKEEPDRVASLGYDAAKVVISVLEKTGGATNAGRIVEGIREMQKFEGASGYISFDKNGRTNNEAVIYKVTPKGFVRVQ